GGEEEEEPGQEGRAVDQFPQHDTSSPPQQIISYQHKFPGMPARSGDIGSDNVWGDEVLSEDVWPASFR
ncbi:MAG: hypothetical protein ACK56F_11865, partial [bacterium]